MKVCNNCHNQKPFEEFPTQIKRGKKVYLGDCRNCKNEKQREGYYRNHESRKAAMREYHAENREKHLEALRAYNQRPDVKTKRKQKHEENREVNLEKMWKQGIKRRYGITFEQYTEMLEKQGGKCAICESEEAWKRSKRFAVDHDHISGKVRALLCHQCNRAIGSMQDSPALLRKAADYIENFRE